MSGDYPDHYILVGRTPVAVDLMTWANWFEQDMQNRRVAFTMIDPDLPVYVSTVFLGLNHRFGDGEPLLFETMAFVPSDRVNLFGRTVERDEHPTVPQQRYATYAEAESGHAEIVAEVNDWLDRLRRQSTIPMPATEPKP